VALYDRHDAFSVIISSLTAVQTRPPPFPVVCQFEMKEAAKAGGTDAQTISTMKTHGLLWPRSGFIGRPSR
jgi:hypothetical protein